MHVGPGFVFVVSMQKHPAPRTARKKAGLTWRALASRARIGLATIKRAEDSGKYPKNHNTRSAYLAALGLTEKRAAS